MGKATVNGPLADAPNVERVFVGIPDVFDSEQFARLHALSAVQHFRYELFRDENNHPASSVTVDEIIDVAEGLAGYLLNGRAEA